ncbi:MAG: 2-hydroxyacyl-CoA dehydratase [Promethearchaeota archaeon]|nr:MAG: 2-hydroxyacyl-CoA dehydratase [Candidatus Lokiarchaeota archaeon]
MEMEIYNKYKKLGRGNWGKDLIMWKAMYTGLLTRFRDEEEFTPFYEFFLNLFLDLPKARREGKPIIMHPFNYGPELFHAMDIEPLMQEIFSVGLAPFHLNEPYIDYTNKIGYGDNPTLCNAQRPLIGTYLQGAAPIPDLLFFLSTPCNSLAMTYQVFHNLTDVPMFNMDIPYWVYDDQTSEFYDAKTMDYMVQQVKDLKNWLENTSNRNFDIEKFQETMKLVNQAREYVVEFNEYLKHVPSPVNSLAGFGNFIVMVTKGGTVDAVNATKYLRDTAAQNIKDGIAGVPDEKLRIAWPYTHVFFDQDLFPWMEETFQANVIMDILGHYQVLPHDVSTLEKCYESLAMGTLDFSMIGTCRGPIEYYIDYVLNFVKDYKIDAVIMPMQFACKHAYTMAGVTAEAIREELGTPVLIFGCDPYDSREVTSEAIRERISEFITQVVL